MADWTAATAYTAGTRVQPTTANGYNYRCTTAGTSAAAEPEWPTLLGATVTDGTVVWQTVSAIGTEIQKLAASAVVELFVLDSTAQGGVVSRFHCGTNQLAASLVWQGETFTPIPLKVSGFEFGGTGKMPRPRMQIANIGGLVSALTLAYGDLLGAKLTRKRTLLKYLDAVNFPGGVNADADPSAEFPDDVYFVDRKSIENKIMVEFELAPAFDVQGVKLPRRQIVQNVCAWTYRSSECSYAGGQVATIADVAVAAPYLLLNGSSGNYARTPDSAAVSITGDIDIRVKAAADDWTPATDAYLISKFPGSPNNSYGLMLRTTGVLRFIFSADGAASIVKDSTAATGIVDGATKWVRVTLDVNNGAGGYDVKFYTSDDGATWAQLGSTVTTATPTSIFDGTGAVELGSNAGGGNPFDGKIYRAQIYNGIGGTVVADFNPADTPTVPATTITSEETGEVWTVQGSASLVYPDTDACGKRLASCKLRFGEFAQLPYGGMPAAGLIR